MTPESVRLAGFGWRLAQGVLDDLFVTTAALALAVAIGIAPSLPELSALHDTADGRWAEWSALALSGGLTYGLYVVLKIAYYVVCVGLWGRTVACRLLGLRIVGDDGGPAGWSRSARRAVAGGLMSHLPGLGHLLRTVDYLAALVTRRRQAVRDIAGSTWLVHARRDRASTNGEHHAAVLLRD